MTPCRRRAGQRRGHRLWWWLVCGTWLAASSAASANVVIDGTRVIYPGDARSVVVQLANHGPRPALVQSWIDAGNADAAPEDSRAPFVVLPPITRIDPDQGQALRITFTGDGSHLPADRESVFFLNVLDIPPARHKTAGPNDQNTLQFAIRSRIKLFYRPDGLPGRANKAPEQLRWHLAAGDGPGQRLVVDNPTAYHVSIIRLAGSRQGPNLLSGPDMLAPRARHSWPLVDAAIGPGATLYVTAIDDFGAARVFTARLESSGSER